MKRKGQIIVGLALILIFILMALAAPVLAPNDPNATNLALKNAPPSAEYPLGCDQMGRCELSRLLYGARYSMGLTIPVLIVLAAFALFVGCYSSYKGGLLDEVMRILCDILWPFHSSSLRWRWCRQWIILWQVSSLPSGFLCWRGFCGWYALMQKLNAERNT